MDRPNGQEVPVSGSPASRRKSASSPPKRAHSYRRESDGCLGRNGALPREDLSSRETGPIVGNIFRNFQQAWEKETGERLPEPDSDFKDYPVKENAPFIQGHLIRTQPQYHAHTIRDSYLLALNNASECIYAENQYFRWAPFADKVKQQAAILAAKGADPRQHDSLYLFVVTNSSEDGMGVGALSTTQMLESLGRADTMPQAARQNRIKDLDAEMVQNGAAISNNEAKIKALEKSLKASPKNGDERRKQAMDRLERDRLEKEKTALEEKRQALEKQREELVKDEKAETIVPQEIPGLKIHICTLVPPDLPPLVEHATESKSISGEIDKNQKAQDAENSDYKTARAVGARYSLQKPPGTAEAEHKEKIRQLADRQEALTDEFQRSGNAAYWRDADGTLFWPEVYVHSKLLIIDDTYMTLGSANINNKSMEGDSELNIAHHNQAVTRQARLDLWEMHTRGYTDKEQKASGSSRNYKKAFEAWTQLIQKNRGFEAAGKSPVASLRGFLRTDPSLTNMD
jgi:phosphatidylserine/phosphatidylglycerophosphate/cardiolipin synthase-like enzyme